MPRLLDSAVQQWEEIMLSLKLFASLAGVVLVGGASVNVLVPQASGPERPQAGYHCFDRTGLWKNAEARANPQVDQLWGDASEETLCGGKVDVVQKTPDGVMIINGKVDHVYDILFLDHGRLVHALADDYSLNDI